MSSNSKKNQVFKFWNPLFLILLSLIFGLGCLDAQAKDSTLQKGRKIYFKQCAQCHGAKGEGVPDQAEDPLTGALSKKSLTNVISKTMPEEDPDDCVGKDASAVAYYIHKTFYSPAAQSRIHPIRVEASRLTVIQFRKSVADLLSVPQGKAIVSKQRGLKAEYFNSRGFNIDKRIVEKIDSKVNFDFGEGSPAEKIEKEVFAIRWKGSLIVPETGEYEIKLDTPNGVKLWLNNASKPFIDAWVASSGQDSKASIFLIGGRSYPLRLEFFKFKQKNSSIRLMWKPPGQVEQIISSRFLTPERSPESVIVSTKFPPDDQSEGYARGNSISKEWFQAVSQSAMEAADLITARMNRFIKAKPGQKDYKEKVRQQCTELVERAFCLKLTKPARNHFVNQYIDKSKDIKTGVRKVIIHTLQSPYFLYQFMEKDVNNYDVASRLSLVLWDSIPDNELWQAARNGSLNDPKVFEKQINRMIRDPKTTAKLHDFFMDWLNVEHFGNISKDKKLFPDFNAQLVADLKTSLDLSIQETIGNEKADFRNLLVSTDLYLNKSLADFYQIKCDANDDFKKVKVNSKDRMGIITHPYLLAGHAYHDNSSPIHRGVFIAKTLLGRRLKPPKDAVVPLPPDLHPKLTTRERIMFQTAPQACVRCHILINPLGFPLEKFDAVGRYQEKEKGRAIDSTGNYQTLSGKVVYFDGAKEMAEFLAGSPEVHSAFIERLFQYSVKQPILAFGTNQQEKLMKSFKKNDFNIYLLLKEIAKASSQTKRKS